MSTTKEARKERRKIVLTVLKEEAIFDRRKKLFNLFAEGAKMMANERSCFSPDGYDRRGEWKFHKNIIIKSNRRAGAVRSDICDAFFYCFLMELRCSSRWEDFFLYFSHSSRRALSTAFAAAGWEIAIFPALIFSRFSFPFFVYIESFLVALGTYIYEKSKWKWVSWFPCWESF